MLNIDESKKRFNHYYKEWLKIIDEIETEQDTRFQIIDIILTEVLGWDRSEIKMEPYTNSGYIDYLLQSEGRNRFVIEAKKISKLLIDTRYPKLNNYNLNGPALKSANEGIDQAKKYCSETGVTFAALTTGLEWICFNAVRADGKPPSEGKAIVFPSLESVSEDYPVFFDLFSKNGILNNLNLIRLNEAEGFKAISSEKLFQVIGKNQIKLLKKSKFASDIDLIFSEFFSTMSGENDPEMLTKCFVETKESRDTDDNLTKISRNLINQIEVVSSAKGEELQEQIRYAVQTKRGEFVLIIGNKGAGKTTFIDRFFRLVLDRELRKKCLVIRVDLADSSGNEATIYDWLISQLRQSIESELFKESTPSYEELQGIYFKEYRRWQKGEFKFLYNEKKTDFKIKFGEQISHFIKDDPKEYVKNLLEHSIRTRGLMPCLIFDNTDHFPQNFQEKVFQFAQSIHRIIYSFIICPITDRTIWQLSKSGPFQSYPTKSYYLPIPPTKEIIKKRLLFINQKLDEEEKEEGKYFLRRGIRLTITNIKAFAACIENILISTDYIARMIGWLSNHDIRRSLRISQRIVTSPLIFLEDLVKTYLSNQKLFIAPFQIKKALILGNYNNFNHKNSEFILNVFTVNTQYISSPILRLSIIRLLIDRDNQSKDIEEAYLSIEDIYNYFEPVGLSKQIMKYHLQELLDFRLLQPYDPTDKKLYEEQRVKITHSGRMHCEFSLNDESYVSHMALVTPIRNYDIVSSIRNIMKDHLEKSGWRKIISIFMKYCIEQDTIFISIPSNPAYDNQSQLRHELYKKWIVSWDEGDTA